MKKEKKKQKERRDLVVYDPKQIYILTTNIISDCDGKNEKGPMCIPKKYLAIKQDEKFYELFSKVEIEYPDNSEPDFVFEKFNIPIIEKVEKLEQYVKDEEQKLTAKELFYFITKENTILTILWYAKKNK